MDKFWSFIRSSENRNLLSWLGGGIVVVIAGLWTVLVYLFPPQTDAPSNTGSVTADCGSAAQRGWSWFSSVTITGSRDCRNVVPGPNEKK